MVLSIISGRKDEFDLRCGMNIQWFGDAVAGRIRDVNGPIEAKHVNLYLVLFYRFVSEWEISSPEDLEIELDAYLRYVESIYDVLNAKEQAQVDFVKNRMPTLMLKKLLNSDGIGYLGSVPVVAADVKSKVDAWSATLSAHINTVEELRKNLDVYENAYNFVGLSQGFSKLYEKKESDLSGYRLNMKIFGTLIFAVLFTELYLLNLNRDFVNSTSMQFLGGVALISLSISLLLIYFFRIALKGADSCKSQMVQIELRKTLCEFVQSYSKYAGQIKEKSPDTLLKFESIIFSNIVFDDDKIISLFEGMEQAGNFMKAARGG